MKGFPFDSNLHLKRRCSGVIWQPIFLDLSQSEKLSEINVLQNEFKPIVV